MAIKFFAFFFRQSVLSDVFGLNGRHHWQLRAAAQRCGAGGCRREATWITSICRLCMIMHGYAWLCMVMHGSASYRWSSSRTQESDGLKKCRDCLNSCCSRWFWAHGLKVPNHDLAQRAKQLPSLIYIGCLNKTLLWKLIKANASTATKLSWPVHHQLQ